MIKLTKLNGETIYLNRHFVVSVESITRYIDAGPIQCGVIRLLGEHTVTVFETPENVLALLKELVGVPV